LASVLPASFSLAAGHHTLRLSGRMALTKIESILVTDDPTADLPLVFEQIPDQLMTLGSQRIITLSIFSPGDGLTDLTASSSDENVVPQSNLVMGGVAGHEKTWIGINPGKLGQTVITVTATSAEGRTGSASFTVSVIGELQAAVNAA